MINKENEKKKNQTINISLAPPISCVGVKGKRKRKTSRSRLIKAFANFFFLLLAFIVRGRPWSIPGTFLSWKLSLLYSFSRVVFDARGLLHFQCGFLRSTLSAVALLIIVLSRFSLLPRQRLSIYLVIEPFPPLHLTSRRSIHRH